MFVILVCSALLPAMLHFSSTQLLAFTRQSHRSCSDIYRAKASWDAKYVWCCWTCTATVRMCQETGGLWQHSWFYPLCLALSKATDTPEDRNNPVLLYNKMELGDLNANFTLEIESQVKKKFFVYHSLLFSFHIDTSCSSLSSSLLYLCGDF